MVPGTNSDCPGYPRFFSSSTFFQKQRFKKNLKNFPEFKSVALWALKISVFHRYKIFIQKNEALITLWKFNFLKGNFLIWCVCASVQKSNYPCVRLNWSENSETVASFSSSPACLSLFFGIVLLESLCAKLRARMDGKKKVYKVLIAMPPPRVCVCACLLQAAFLLPWLLLLLQRQTL